MGTKQKQTAKTVETAFGMLEYIKVQDGSTLSEITQEFGLAKSTVHRHMTTVMELGYVVKEDGEYFPSVRFLDMGEYVRERKQLFELAEPKIDELAAETGEQVHFVVEVHGKGITVHYSTGPKSVKTNPGLGKPLELHTTAAGKAILSQMDDDEVKAIVDKHGVAAKTKHTITTWEELQADLETVRERGFSLNQHERTEGLCAVGVPVSSPNYFGRSAISISGPANRMKGDLLEEEIPDLLRGTANEIELNLTR